MKTPPFVPVILLAVQCGFAGGTSWPFITIRQTGLFAGNQETLRQIVECHRRHPGACDEFWFATGSRKTIPDVAKECEAFAYCRALCEEAGILPGYQQGLTLGHGERPDILTNPRVGEQQFPADAYQVRADGTFLGLLCPRSPFVLDYEREYAKAVMRVANPVSYWLDDDLRLGVAHAEGCFCNRCIAAFNKKTGGSWTREALVARLFSKVPREPVRAQWSEFNAESLALYAAQVRKAADELGSDCRLGYQSVSADRLYPARDYGPLLAALSGPGRKGAGIRPGDGFYDESGPRGMVAKCLGVAREAERCRHLTPQRGDISGKVALNGPQGRLNADGCDLVASVCYEQETYPRHLLHKSPGAIMTECALALASGCDSLSLYWFPSEAPMPVAEYDRFLSTLLRARPYFERLAASTRRTRLGGVARFVGSAAAETAGFDLRDPTDFDLACAGIPVTVAEGAPCAFYLTDKSRVEMTEADKMLFSGCSPLSKQLDTRHSSLVTRHSTAEPSAPAVVDISNMGKFPLASRRAKLLDDLDAVTGGLFPVRIDECRPLRILPRVRDDGRLDSVTILNLSIGGTDEIHVRVRRPVSRMAFMQDTAKTMPVPVECTPGTTPEEAVVTLADIGPWQIVTLFFGEGPETIVLENAALRAEVVPAWAGRLIFLGRPGGANVLWTNPSAATNAPTNGRDRVWRNFGGNKTWVGEMEAVWPGFQNPPTDASWPPPDWFDAAPLEVVRANATNVLLRSGSHTNAALGWTVALEREFTLLPDRLVLREKLSDISRKDFASSAAPDDPRRVWSNTQIPFTPHVAIRRAAEGRERLLRGCPVPTPRGDGSNWADLGLADAPQHARIDADGDALAAEISGVGWLLIEQSAPERHLSAFATPSRAIVYTTGRAARNPFVELEFVALGPDAEQTTSFQILESRP